MIDDRKLCKNCNIEIVDSYCSNCGQKYRERKETLRDLLYEFMGSFTNFDSKFFRTLIPLLFRPGKLTMQYMEGKHASQIHPIRLYLFSSFLYFLFFLGCAETPGTISSSRQSADRKEVSESWENSTTNDNKGEGIVVGPLSIRNKTKGSNVTVVSDEDSTLKLSITGVEGLDSLINADVKPDEYLAIQQLKSPDEQDGFLKRYIIHHSLKLYYKGKEDGKGLITKIFESVINNVPKMLFVLLPLFALLLKLLYLRHKKFNYVDHAVLGLHFFSLVFILLLISQFVLDKIFNTEIFTTTAVIWFSIYFLIAMRRIFKQKFFKTFVKFTLLGFSFFILLISAFVITVFISAFALA